MDTSRFERDSRSHIVTRNLADHRFSVSSDEDVDLSIFPSVCSPKSF